MIAKSRLAVLVSFAVLAISGIVYLMTLTPTVPFWDSGEFIAVSKILGIPHPPGTPFFVMIGRLCTLIPFWSPARSVNGLSAVSAALAVWLTYLCTLRMVRLAQGENRQPWHEWAAVAGSAVAALMLAFSDNFWENSIEAEVYQMMSLASVLVLWLGLKWWDDHGKKPTVAPLLVATYVMWLSVGLHLGVALMGGPLLALVFVVDWRVGVLFLMPFAVLLRVNQGLEMMGGWGLICVIVSFLVYAWQGKLPKIIAIAEAAGVLVGGMLVMQSRVSQAQAAGLGDYFASHAQALAVVGIVGVIALVLWFVLEAVRSQAWILAVPLGIGAAVGVFYAMSDANFTTPGALLATLAAVAPMVLMAPKHREGRILLLVLFLIVAGYSTHLYLPIRAAQHPAINEGAPATWDRLSYLLERKQYGEMHLFPRRGGDAWGGWKVQLDKEFWRYWVRQWPILPGGRLPWSAMIPLLLGVIGAGWQAMRDKKGFTYNFVFFFLNTAGLIVFLNFSDHEVRDRDYFFQSGYHAFAIWIGFGVAWLIGWIRESFAEGAVRNWATGAATALLCAQPFLLMHNLWYTHDRSHNYIARDYAYDMLAPLKPNSFLFTNGDNDTFPLWYIQQVEGFRTDVRIVNLSLLNTDWYIRQLKDENPKVPIELDDRNIDVLGQGWVQDSTGHAVYTNEYMVHHIMQHARNANGTWKMQPYFAVTVPEHYGYEPYFSLQGLVYEVKTDSSQGGLDVEATKHALYDQFMYRGLFTKEGAWDSTVYKDENAETLSRNFAAAHLQLALYYRRTGRLKEAIGEMERVERMFPRFAEVLLPLGQFYVEAGDTARAVALYRDLAQREPNNPEVRYYAGAAFALQGNLEACIREFEAAIALSPDYGQPYYSAYFALRSAGQRERALGYLQRWIDGHPGDTQAMQLLQSERGQAGGPKGITQAPPPNVQTIP